MEAWREGQYGKYLRMSTAHSLRELRRLWKLWAAFEDLPSAQKVQIRRKFKEGQDKSTPKSAFDLSLARSAGPLAGEAALIVLEEFGRFWKTGQTDPRAPPSKLERLNPTFVYSSSGEDFATHYATFPIGAFHLAPGLVPLVGLSEGAKATPNTLFDLAQTQLLDWAKAFRHCVSEAPKVVLRFHVGDALAFCEALGQLIDPKPSNLSIYTKPWAAVPLVLEATEYRRRSFDVIDTSNLADPLGIINVLVSVRPLLSRTPFSVLYTETLRPAGRDYTKAFSEQLCGDLNVMSLLFDLAPVTLLSKMTTHSNIHELFHQATENVSQFHERIAWKIPSLIVQVVEDNNFDSVAPRLSFEHSRLRGLLYGIFNAMFTHEDQFRMMQSMKTADAEEMKQMIRQSTLYHHICESFVLFLRLVQSRVDLQEWQSAMESFTNRFKSDFFSYISLCPDLLLRMHVHGIHISRSIQPGIPEQRPNLKLFPRWPVVPLCAWITLQIPRSKLKSLEAISPEAIGSPGLRCEIRPTHMGVYYFSHIHTAFGSASFSDADDGPTVTLLEDKSGWSGRSALLVWFQGPTWLLTEDPDVAKITFVIKRTLGTMHELDKVLGKDLIIHATNLGISNNVFLTPTPPKISTTPFIRPSPGTPPIAAKRASKDLVQVALDSSFNSILTLTRRVNITDPKASLVLANPETLVSVSSQQFPSSILLRIGDILYTVTFPLPIDGARTKLRIARKSHYVEVSIALI